MYRAKRTRVLAVLLGLLCAATAVAWAAWSGGSAGESMATAADPDRPAPAARPSTTPQKGANQVVIDNFRFEPRQLTVAAGTRVTWVNRDDVPHTATSMARPKVFDSKALDTDQQFSHVFTTPGRYEYFCAVHPHMRGEIVVK
jgi:plastocyanin